MSNDNCPLRHSRLYGCLGGNMHAPSTYNKYMSEYQIAHICSTESKMPND